MPQSAPSLMFRDSPSTGASWAAARRWGAGAFLLSLLAHALCLWLLGRTEAAQPREALLFAEPSLETVAARLPADALASLPAGAGRVRGVRAKAGAYCPIVRWVRVVPVRTGSGRILYAAPALLYHREAKTARYRAGLAERGFWMLLAAALAAGGTMLFVLEGGRLGGLVLGGLALRAGALAWRFALFGYYSVHTNDETVYLRMARRLLEGDFGPGTEPYPLGLPLLYTPLAACMPEATALRFAQVWSGVAFPLFTALLLFGLGGLLGELGLSGRARRWAVAAAVLFPGFTAIYHVASPAMGSLLFTTLGPNLGFPPDGNYLEYLYFAQWIGWNALSDTPALAFALAGLYLLARNLRRGGALWPGAALLAGACLVRLPAVFVLLPAAVLCRRRGGPWRLRHAVELAAPFLLAAGLQMAWNAAVLGDPLTLGYARRAADYAGFEWAHLGNGLSILSAMHFALLAGGALGLACWRRNEGAAILALLLLPTLVFYGGYHGIGTAPVRYVLLPLTLCTALGGAAAGAEASGEARAFAAAGLLSPLLLVPGLPLAAYLLPVPGWLGPLAWLAAAVMVLWRGRRWRWALFFAILALGIPPVALAALLAAGAARVLLLLRPGAPEAEEAIEGKGSRCDWPA